MIRVNYFTFAVVYYRPQTKFAKAMFLHLSVSHSVRGGVCLSTCLDTPPKQTTPWEADTPEDADPPWKADTPPAQCMLGDTGNKRAVSILLECILVHHQCTFTLSNCVSLFMKAKMGCTVCFEIFQNPFLYAQCGCALKASSH